MSRLAVVVGMVVLVCAGSVLAGARKEALAHKEASGAFVSASPKEGAAAFELKVALDNEGEKVLELPARLAIAYVEKNGQKHARLVRVPGRREPAAKGNALIAQGTLVKAELLGARVTLTLKSGEGDAAAEERYLMPSRLAIAYRDEGGKLIVHSLGPAARGERAEKPAKRERARKGQQPDAKPPENL